MTMRRSATLLALFAITLTSCFDQGANDEDQQRLNRLIDDPIVTVRVEGTTAASEMTTSLAESSSAVLDGVDTANVVRLTYRFEDPPTDQRLHEAATAYAEALTDAGWDGVNAECIETTEGPTDVRLRARRNDHGYVETALVAFEPYASELWTIVVSVAAPRHDDAFDTATSQRNLDCIDTAHT